MRRAVRVSRRAHRVEDGRRADARCAWRRAVAGCCAFRLRRRARRPLQRLLAARHAAAVQGCLLDQQRLVVPAARARTLPGSACGSC